MASFTQLQDGLPLGIDSPSHLFKILYSHKVFNDTGHFPTWCSDWYGGTPFLHFYPPLSYLLTFFLSLSSMGPLIAYKIVDVLFYIITPFTIFFLGRSLGLKRIQSILACIFFSLTPVLLENFLFYDRFTTTLSIPFLCLFLISIIKALENGKNHSFIISSFLMTILLLTHHLTVYYLGIILLLLITVSFLKTRNRTSLLQIFIFAGIIPILLSSFWLIPFAKSIPLLLENPFYNRSNVENFISPEGFLAQIVPLGIQFVLAVIEVTLQLFPKKVLTKPMHFFNLLFPSSSILIGSLISMWNLGLGQILVILGFIYFLMIVCTRVRAGKLNETYYIFCLSWFISFLWLSLGYSGILFRLLPFSQSLDVLRFKVYLSIPQSILAGKFVSRFLSSDLSKNRDLRLPRWKGKFLPTFIIILLLSISTVSFCIAKNMTYQGTTYIPTDIIEFFKSSSESGRLLPIKCPHWIYVLPYYTGKPIIDGWYPQEKLLKPLLEINDYQINTLNEYNRTEQIHIWSNLIGNSSKLGLKWVMIGNLTYDTIMLDHSTFAMVQRFENVTIYENKSTISLIDVDRTDLLDEIEFNQLSPDNLTLKVDTVRERVNITVKIANFEGWKLEVNGRVIKHSQNRDGFIFFSLDEGSHYSINLTYEKQGMHYLWFSLIGVLLLTVFYVLSKYYLKWLLSFEKIFKSL
jgi:hypothetical protein